MLKFYFDFLSSTSVESKTSTNILFKSTRRMFKQFPEFSQVHMFCNHIMITYVCIICHAWLCMTARQNTPLECFHVKHLFIRTQGWSRWRLRLIYRCHSAHIACHIKNMQNEDSKVAVTKWLDFCVRGADRWLMYLNGFF